MPPAGSVQLASASARASPKSATRTTPCSSNRRLAGFTSRCSTSRACAYSSAGRDVAADPGGLGDGQQGAPVEHRPEAAALEQLEHHERHVVLAPVVDRDDVGVAQRRRQLGLGPEAPEERGVVGERRVQHLDRDAPAQPLVVGDVDATARAGTDRVVQEVATGRAPGPGAGRWKRFPACDHRTVSGRVCTRHRLRAAFRKRRVQPVRFGRGAAPTATSGTRRVGRGRRAHRRQRRDLRHAQRSARHPSPQRPPAVLALSPQENEIALPQDNRSSFRLKAKYTRS